MSERKKNAAPQPAVRTFRNASNGSDYAVGLQVAAPYGGSYQIDVEVGMVDGAELLSHAQAGQLIVLEGYLTRTREVDRRFRDFEEEMIEGIFYQDVALQVERVRPHQQADPRAPARTSGSRAPSSSRRCSFATPSSPISSWPASASRRARRPR
jgi:hypothetical protein